MSVPILAQPLRAPSNVDWDETFDFYEPDDVTPESFAGCVAEIGLQNSAGGPPVLLRSDQGTALITWEIENGSLNRVQAAWPEAQIAPGDYAGEIRLFRPGGHVEPLLLFTVVFSPGIGP